MTASIPLHTHTHTTHTHTHHTHTTHMAHTHATYIHPTRHTHATHTRHTHATHTHHTLHTYHTQHRFKLLTSQRVRSIMHCNDVDSLFRYDFPSILKLRVPGTPSHEEVKEVSVAMATKRMTCQQSHCLWAHTVSMRRFAKYGRVAGSHPTT